MFEKGRKKGTYRFVLRSTNGVAKVALAGDFNNWQPARMRKQKDGSHVSIVPLAPGTYEYKFIVDGRWVVDEENGAFAWNPYGSVNSVAVAQ